MKTKKILMLFLMLLLATTFVACGPKPAPGPGPEQGDSGDKTPETVKVNFDGASTSQVTLNKGDMLQKPTTPPDKVSSQFENWYLDSSYSTLATFPMKVDKDTTIYAKYVDFKEFFLNSREKITNAKGYEYDYNLEVTAALASLTLTGKQDGNVKYNKNNSISFIDYHVNSDKLFNSNKVYKYINNGSVNSITLNENNEVIKHTSETTQDEDITKPTLAKAIFEYQDGDIKSITKSGNKYTIKTKANASSLANSLSSILNNPIVEKIINTDLPSNDVDTSFTVTYNDNQISKYEYFFTVSVSKLTLTIKYTLTFKSIDKDVSISLPTLPNLHVVSNQINTDLSSIKQAIDSFKASNSSSNEFKIKTGVDYGLTSSEINATIKGESKRVNNGKLNYVNKTEIDSDLKNADLYKETGLKDITVVSGNLTDGKVYNREKGLIKYGDALEITDTNKKNMNSFIYLLDSSFFSLDNTTSINVEKKNGSTFYSINLSANGINALIDFINSSVDLNPFIQASISVLGTIDKTTLDCSKITLVVEVGSDNELLSIEGSFKGKGNVKYADSRDFFKYDLATITVDYSYKVKTNQVTYEAPASVNDLKY